MVRRLLLPVLTLALLCAARAMGADDRAVPETTPTPSIAFNRDVRPILSDHCFACHGPDSTHRKANMRFDRQEGLFDPHDKGPAFVAWHPEKSQALTRIFSSDPDQLMPPPKSNKPLTAAEKSLLNRWVAAGAPWEPLWSLVSPVRPALPTAKDNGWVRNPIDAFVLARLQSQGLAPAPQADRRALIRRVSLDLNGIPPTPAEVDAFVNDAAPDAYEKVVDRLLASPRYGEHEGRYWLDAARYADTHGIHNDNYVELWPYRDWVIGAFNRNLPFDRFTVEQIAGDLLPNHTLEQEVATGFHRCNATTSEGGSIDAEVQAMYAKDRVETTYAVWLGLTAQCSSCHDHKFDPLSQKEFYEFSAFFRNTPQPAMDGNIANTPPNIPVPPENVRARWNALQSEQSALAERAKDLKADAVKPFEAWVKAGKARCNSLPLDPTALRWSLELNCGEKVMIHKRPEAHPASGNAAPSGPGSDRLASATSASALTWAEAFFPGSLGLRNAAVERAKTDELSEIELNGDLRIGPGMAGDERALQFGPGAGLSVEGAGNFDGKLPFSLGGWIYVPQKQGQYIIASKVSSGAKDGAGWVLEIDKRVFVFKLIGDRGGRDALRIRARKAITLEDGAWQHVFVTYDGSRDIDGLTLYVNGKPEMLDKGDDISVTGSAHNDAPARLGSNGTRDFAGGAIQDFRFFSRAVRAEEVMVLRDYPGLRRELRPIEPKLTPEQRNQLLLFYLNRFDPPYQAAMDRLERVREELRTIRRRSPEALVMVENRDAQPMAHVLFRGQYDQERDLVHAGTPAALHAFPKEWPHNRLGLAWWLVDKNNPLTARVTINRYWQQLFGQGLVRTADDFGIMGEFPSHPELLDWLAVEFREPTAPNQGQAWDVKRMLRLMVTSATYRQSSQISPEKLAADPDNRLLCRGPRFRMDAEVLRDFALSSSGLLAEKIGGPSVKPYQPPGVWEAVAMFGSNTRFYKPDSGQSLYRRSLYTFWKRSAPPASMDIFNAPGRLQCTVRRDRTDTPLQALVIMNDPQWVEAARHLAERAMKEGGGTFDGRLDFITRRIVSRVYSPDEKAICRATLDDLLKSYAADKAAATALIHTGESKPAEDIAPADLAAWTLLASEVFNTDEALNK